MSDSSDSEAADPLAALSTSASRGAGAKEEVPIGKMLAARKDGSTKRAHRPKAATAPQALQGRKNRHHPTELSSKAPAPRLREAVESRKRRRRDPRFDALSGEFDERHFERAYGFVDDIQEQEIKQAEKSLRKVKSERRKEEIQREAQSKRSKLQAKAAKQKRQEVLRSHVRGERERVAEGKNPFFLKKSELRRRELVDKFQELKDNGRLDKFLAKRRRKNASKDHKRVPMQTRE